MGGAPACIKAAAALRQYPQLREIERKRGGGGQQSIAASARASTIWSLPWYLDCAVPVEVGGVEGRPSLHGAVAERASGGRETTGEGTDTVQKRSILLACDCE